MPNTFNSNSFSSTYKDDWSETDNYHKILFNSGRSLQARELTQLQTIIQKEIERFGSNIFKEGAAVDAGTPSINSNYRYVKLATATGPVGSSFANVPVGLEITGTVTGVVARVIEAVASTGSDPDTLYVQYTSAGTQNASTATVQFAPNEIITATNWNFRVADGASDPVGAGTKFRVSEGDFYVLGHFVHASEQDIFLSKYSQVTNTTVGYKVTQDIVTVDDDTALYDNAGPSPNTAAPGADRYRITMTLAEQANVSSDDTFVYFAKVENSKIVDVATSIDGFNKINDLLALRTYEESGNYIVHPFTMNMDEIDGDNNNLDLIVSAGRAYVNGYRVNNPSPIRLTVPKPQGTETITNQSVGISYGNYFLANGNAGIPDLSYGEVNISTNVSDPSSNVIGTCRVRAIEEDGANYKVYVFDVETTTGGDLRAARSIGTGATDYITLLPNTSNEVFLNDVGNNDLLFDLPRPRPSNITNISITTQRYSGSITTGGTSISLPTLSAGETYTDTGLWIVSEVGGGISTSATVVLTNADQNAQINNLSAGDWEVYFYVNNNNGTAAGKEITVGEVTGTIQTDPDTGVKYLDLGVHDIYDVSQVTLIDVNGEDVSGMFTLDNGQRDNYYAIGRLILDEGKTIAGNIFCRFRYFNRTSSGNFYDINSYDVSYAEIPNHRLKNGSIVELREFVDFRPDKLANGSFANVKELPRNGSNFTADVAFYLPRADKLIVSQEGEFSLLKGEQAEVPQFKKTPENSLELYKIVLNANTLDAQDLSVTPIEHKRYTMADINKLERKLDKLEETTTLSFVELDSKLETLKDSAGNARPETGFVVDNFSDQVSTDTEIDDYRASIDPESKLLRPGFDEDNIRLIYDNVASSGVTLKGDNIYLNYDSAEFISQNIASNSVPVNIFKNAENIGCIVLSPSSDEWKGTGYSGSRTVDGSTRLDRKEALLWNNWEWNWAGRSIEDIEVPEDRPTISTGVVRNRRFGAFGRRGLYELRKYSSEKTRRQTNTSTRGHVSRVVSSETIRSTIGNRVIDAAITPWMRSRKIYFHAKGLKPNTKFVPFFDGVNVSDWVRIETSFDRFAGRDDDQGNLQTNQAVTSHPDGSSTLVSSATGEIKGSFFIPNIRPSLGVKNYIEPATETSGGLRFRTGTREFKLLDITENDYSVAGSKAVAFYTAAGAIENKRPTVLSTRAPEFTGPIWEGGAFPSVYSAPEVQQYLDGITDGQIDLLDAKVPGLNSPGQTPVNPSLYNGTMSTLLNDYVSVNSNQYNSTSILPVASRENPLAQSFKVNNQFGVTLTKIDLYFETKDDDLPVQLQIRPMENGSPSRSEIIPGSCVFKNANEVSVPSNTSNISSIQSAPTSFEFDEPVYLNPWTEYAIVLLTSSNDYKVYTASNDEYVLGSTNRRVSTSSVYGNLYRNSFGVTWEPSKNSNLMYKAYRAVFNTNGSLILRNANVPGKLLKNNPIETTSGSSYVYVKHACHGFDSGETVSITLDGTQTYAGIPGTQLNTSHTIFGKDVHGYRIKVTAAATDTANIGGDDVVASRNVQYNVINPMIESIVPGATSIDVSAKLTTGRSVSGNEQKYNKDGSYLRMTPKVNTSFNSPRVVANRTIESLAVAEIPNALALNGAYSAEFKVDMKSGNNYVSPVIDMQRASMVLVGYCIDDGETGSYINYVAETDPYSGTTGSKHVTTPFTLAEDAVGMQIKVNANVPPSSDFDVYWRTATEGQNIYDRTWIKENKAFPTPKDEDPDSFRENQFLPGGIGGDLQPFNTAQVKLVMKSTSMAEVPSFRDLSVKFLGV